MMQVLLLLTPVLLLLVVRFLLYWYRVIRYVERIPGPRAYPFIGNMLLFIVPSNKLAQVLKKLTVDYGPIHRVWLGPIPTVMINDPKYSEVILGNMKHIDKPLHYKLIEPWVGKGLLTAKGNTWHRRRKMISPAFHFNILNSFIETFSEKSKILVDVLKHEIDSPGFDINPYIENLAMDIICETSMGIKMNTQEQDGKTKYAKSLHILSKCAMERLFRPWLYPDFIYRLTPSGRLFFKTLEIVDSYNEKVIASRKLLMQTCKKQRKEEDEDVTGMKKRKVFLDLMLEAQDEGTKLTDRELRDEVNTLMFGGQDTTSCTMGWCIQILGEYPDAQEKAYEEQQEIFQGSGRAPDMTDLGKMKYLERVIKEVMRLYGIIALFGRVLREDTLIGKYKIPAGTTVSMYSYSIHRLPEYYPGDPEKFDPDNFLPEKVASRHRYAYIPFSAGPRNCIGQKFAMLEMKMVLSYLLRNYIFHSLRKNLPVLPEIIMKPEGGIQVTISPRHS